MIFPEASIYAYTPMRSTEMAELTVHCNLLPAEPLRKRVPERDTDGGPLADVMVLLPGLRDLPQHLLRTAIAQIQAVCAYYSHAVAFAELNIRLNLLFVSVRPITGVRNEIFDAVRGFLPQARLVSHI